MRLLGALALSLAAFPTPAQEREIQRALIQRDQMTAEFAAGVRGADVQRLQNLHASQLHEVTLPLQPELRPYQRQNMADERELRLPPPVVLTKSGSDPDLRPLPLPGRLGHVVDPVPAQGLLY